MTTPTLADNLLRLRTERGMTREELAEAADVGSYTIAKIENGTTYRPYLYTMTQIAEALDCSVDDLCGLPYGEWVSTHKRYGGTA